MLGEAGGDRWPPRGFIAGPQRLVRSDDGTMQLEVIGYEMEEVPMLRAVNWR